MRVFDYLVYVIALLLYPIRLILFWVYRALLFISKPGAAYIVSGVLGGLLYWQYERIVETPLFEWWVIDIVAYYLPHYPLLEPYWYVGLFWAGFAFFLYLITGGERRVLGTVLSALPQIRRPFPPELKLRLVERKIIPAAVSISVPKLKRRRKGRHAPDIAAGLSEPLQRLLAPPMPSAPPEPQEDPETPPEASEEVQELPTAQEPTAAASAPSPAPTEGEPETSPIEEQEEQPDPEPEAPSRKPPAPFVPPRIDSTNAE